MDKRRTGRARIFIFFILIGIISIAYIWNSYVVDKRANEVAKLEEKLEQLKMERLFLESLYERLISVNYVVPFATKKLGLVFPKESPKEIEVDKDEF